MRFGLALMVLGLVAGISALPAFAQQQQQQQQLYQYNGGYTNPTLYNSPGNYTQQSDGGSIYNSGANLQMLPMQQMTAGKNAPSYTYGGQKNASMYNYGSMSGLDPNAAGALSPDQARAIRAQRDAQAQTYQQQYMQTLQQQQNPYAQQAQQMMSAGSQYQGSSFGALYADSDQQKPTKKKVIYKQLNNPLVEPPRLFNID